MSRGPRRSNFLLLGVLSDVVSPGGTWAHHPGPGTDEGWSWLWILAVVVAAIIWPVLAFMERPQRPAARRRRPSRR
jgi:hypothetical protein